VVQSQVGGGGGGQQEGRRPEGGYHFCTEVLAHELAALLQDPSACLLPVCCLWGWTVAAA
jgi:hypothetical protein